MPDLFRRPPAHQTVDHPSEFRADRRRVSLVALLALATSLLGCAHRETRVDVPEAPIAPASLSEADREIYLQTFDAIWNTVRDTYWEPDFGGVDWDQVKVRLRPGVEEATDADQVYTVLRELVGALGQSHFVLIPRSTYAQMSAGLAHGAQVGLDFRVIDGEAVVTEVYPGLDAERAGVRTGWTILQTGVTEWQGLLEELKTLYAESPFRDFEIKRALESRLHGPVGVPIAVNFRDAQGDVEKRVIPAEHAPGEIVRFQGMSIPFDFAHERLDSGVEYVRFSSFAPPLIGRFQSVMEALGGAKGLVIDVRGNPGGIGVLASTLASWLYEYTGESSEGIYLGTMQMRRGDEMRFVVNPRLRAYLGPVAVLIDECSASTSEIFAAGLQDLGRARIFGTRTAGAALPSIIEDLPSGDAFQHAIANYTSRNGTVLEASGVEPDVNIRSTRSSLLEGRDVVLDAAVAWIRTQAPVPAGSKD